MHRPLLSPAVAAAILATALLAWLFAPPALLVGWLDEGGPVEDLTVLLYLVATLCALAAAARRDAGNSGIALAVVMLSFAARELHLHIEYTGTSVLRLSYYFSDAPLLHRLVAFAAVGSVAASMALLAWRHGRSMVAGVRARSARAITALTTLVILVLTKLVDRSLGVMRELFDLKACAGLRALQVAVEEPLEMGLPLLVMVGLLQVAFTSETRSSPDRY